MERFFQSLWASHNILPLNTNQSLNYDYESRRISIDLGSNTVTAATTKLLSAQVKNSKVILRIVLPILTKFLQKSQIRRALLQEVAKQSSE